MSFNLLQLAISSIQYKNLYLENRYKLRIATPDELFCEQEEESMIKIEEALLSDTQKKLDKALKRNLIGQAQQVAATPKTSTAELPVEEPISESDENLDE